MNKQTQPVPVTGAEHPLRQARLRRGLTQVGLAGLASSYISMIERGRRKLTRRDHVNALAAALKVPPAEIAPSMIAGSDEWAPAPASACAFPPARVISADSTERGRAG
jgi:transcriptional regulator with XRE-family HTH domain